MPYSAYPDWVQHPIAYVLFFGGLIALIWTAVRYVKARRSRNVPKRIYYRQLCFGNLFLFLAGDVYRAADGPPGKDAERSALDVVLFISLAVYFWATARGKRMRAETDTMDKK